MNLPLPELPDFEYEKPATFKQATTLLHENGAAARVFMGGTDLFVQMRGRDRHPHLLVDIKQLPGLTDISFDLDRGLRVGAAVTMNNIAKHPEVREYYALLVEAIETVASYQLRNRATMGGNLANASPAADTAPAGLVLKATLGIKGPGGERKIPLREFFKGPGETVLEGDEILTSIEFPVPETGLIGRYIKLGRNAEGDLAIAGVAVAGFPDKGSASGYQFRIAMASVAPTPIRAPEAEAILAEGAISDERINLAALAAEDVASPIDDIRATAKYRKAMVRELSLQALSNVWTQLQKEA